MTWVVCNRNCVEPHPEAKASLMGVVMFARLSELSFCIFIFVEK